MKKNEVKIGSVYTAMISGKLAKVRIDKPIERSGYGPNAKTTTHWAATNLVTGRSVEIKSAAKLRREVTEKPATVTPNVSAAKPVSLPNTAAKTTPAVSPVARAGITAVAAPAPVNSKWKLSEVLAGNKTAQRASVDTAPHLIVEALAGTGKTTTLVGGLNFIRGKRMDITPSPQQAAVWDSMKLSAGKVESIAFVAFNKSIKEELARRIPEGCSAMTMHGLGNKSITRAFGRVALEPNNGDRVSSIISEFLGKDIRELRRENITLIQATIQLVALCKQNLVGTGWSDDELRISSINWYDALDKLSGHYDVELNGSREKVYDLVPKVLERCKDVDRDRNIDFNDMIWLPIALNLPLYRYDLLLVDEAQDLNRCQQQLAIRSGRRLILCGDRNQAIYGFAGADADSIPRMTEMLKATDRGCEVLPLTVTRRCGKNIVKEAQKIVPTFEAFETNGDGVISTAAYEDKEANTYTKRVASGDMCLCRVNAPLVSQCFRFLKAGRKATIQGRDIGQGLISTINKLKASDVPDLMGKLEEWHAKEVAKETVKKNPSEQKLIALEDRKACLFAFCEESVTITDVTSKIERVFTDGGDGIKFSSVHRAKGLEAKRVFILQPKGAEMPHPMAKSAWQRGQEMNILYVAITRAIEELVYVR